MSWDGNYWGPDGALAKEFRAYAVSAKGPAEKVRYASAQHSAAGRAWAECRYHYKFWYLLWVFYHGLRALMFVEAAWKQQKDREELLRDLDKVDVSCAIWRRWGWLCGGRRNLVRKVLKWIDWLSAVNNPDVKVHTRAFLIVHAIAVGLGEKSTIWKWKLETLAKEACESGETDQGGRVWKYIYELYGDEAARSVAVTLSGLDQRRKMGFSGDSGEGA